ncbi:MAG: response regulator [Candidatus Peribacteraceae bacterium]|jgi:DNA-binding response OmpR family regulator
MATRTSSSQKILIVEDERPLAHALELKLKREGFDVTVCLTGPEGMKEAITGKYSIILLDIIMPEVDGFALLQEMSKKKVKTPVLVLSNLGLDEDKQKAKGLGVIDYFVKANTPIANIVKRVKAALE